MLEKKKTGMFRGLHWIMVVVWFWDLFYMGLEFFVAATQHSTLALVFGFGFLGLWLWAERIRKDANRSYDQLYALREEALAYAKVSSRDRV